MTEMYNIKNEVARDILKELYGVYLKCKSSLDYYRETNKEVLATDFAAKREELAKLREITIDTEGLTQEQAHEKTREIGIKIIGLEGEINYFEKLTDNINHAITNANETMFHFNTIAKYLEDGFITKEIEELK